MVANNKLQIIFNHDNITVVSNGLVAAYDGSLQSSD